MRQLFVAAFSLLIAAHPTLGATEQLFRVQEAALSKVIEGVTDIKEITRALTAPDSKKPRSAKSASSGPKVKEKD